MRARRRPGAGDTPEPRDARRVDRTSWLSTRCRTYTAKERPRGRSHPPQPHPQQRHLHTHRLGQDDAHRAHPVLHGSDPQNPRSARQGRCVGAKMDSMDLEREKGITIQSAATVARRSDERAVDVIARDVVDARYAVARSFIGLTERARALHTKTTLAGLAERRRSRVLRRDVGVGQAGVEDEGVRRRCDVGFVGALRSAVLSRAVAAWDGVGRSTSVIIETRAGEDSPTSPTRCR